MTAALLDGSARAIAEAVRTGAASAREIAQETLSRIKARNTALGAFTDVTAVRALAKADAIDAARARGESLGRSQGRRSRSRTCSTSKACRRAPAPRSIATARRPEADATVLARLEAAGGVLIGSLNMGEYAYDFTGQMPTTARPAIPTTSST